jgi:hypothetical protein
MPALQRDTLADGTSFLGDNGAVAAAANEIRLQVRAVRDISRPEQGPVAGTTDQVGPMTSQQGFATARFRLADLLLIRPHQVAAERRPRIEARHH